MKLNTLEKLYNCLKFELPEVTLSDDLINQAKAPIIKMLDISAKLGL
jgi:quinolinate synthase